MAAIPTTNTIRHATRETDDVKYTHSSDVAKDVLDVLTPILHDAVDSGKPTQVRPSRYWIRIEGTSGNCWPTSATRILATGISQR